MLLLTETMLRANTKTTNLEVTAGPSRPPFYSLYLAIHSALPLYISSSFLSTYVPDATVGFLYAGASLLTLFILTRLPRVLNRFGNRRTALFFVFLEMLALRVMLPRKEIR